MARERLPAERYLREESLLADLEKGAPASDAGYRPAGKLMFAQKPHSDSQEWLLAWVFRLYVLPLEHSRELYVTEIPIHISAGNRLRAQLIDNHGNVLAAADNVEKSAQGNILRLKSGRLSEGIYSLRFSDFGNGSEIAVRLPGSG